MLLALGNSWGGAWVLDDHTISSACTRERVVGYNPVLYVHLFCGNLPRTHKLRPGLELM